MLRGKAVREHRLSGRGGCPGRRRLAISWYLELDGQVHAHRDAVGPPAGRLEAELMGTGHRRGIELGVTARPLYSRRIHGADPRHMDLEQRFALDAGIPQLLGVMEG